MNLCFIIGKIASDIQFNFMLGSYHISIVTFQIVLDNGSLLNIIAYDEIADWCYQNLMKNNWIALHGELNSKMEIIIQNINYL